MLDNVHIPNIPAHRAEKLAYTVAGWCDASGLGRSTTYELIANGKLKAVKCGNRTLIPADEARRFLATLPRMVG